MQDFYTCTGGHYPHPQDKAVLTSRRKDSAKFRMIKTLLIESWEMLQATQSSHTMQHMIVSKSGEIGSMSVIS